MKQSLHAAVATSNNEIAQTNNVRDGRKDDEEISLRGVRAAVADVVEDMNRQREPIPEPLASRSFSVKFMVRVPPNVHRELALEAAEAGVSLNRLASAKLTH